MNLKVTNLSFSFGEKILFKDLNLDFSVPQFTWIRGPSGCGKSTFLKLVAGLLPPQQGDIVFDSDEVRIGYVHQDCHLIDHWSVEENLRIGQWVSDEYQKHFGRQLETLFKKFDLNISKKTLAKNLSGGERQRVSLMRIFLQNPDVILLDEPTAHLDDLHTHEAMTILNDAFAGKLVLVVSHDSRVEKFAKRTIDWAVDTLKVRS